MKSEELFMRLCDLFLKIERKVRVLIKNIRYLKFYQVRYPGGPTIKKLFSEPTKNKGVFCFFHS